MTSATETSHPDMRKLEIPDANFSFHYMPVDEELILPLFPGLILDGPRERLLAIRGWETRQDDIFLTSFPKAGTHWTWEILSMLTHGKAEYRKESKRALQPEMVPDFDFFETEKSPRVFTTHVPFRWLPKKHIENGGKIVHVMRNPKDVYLSLYYHIKGQSAPLVGSNIDDLTWDNFFKILITENNIMKKFFDGWFAYERGMEDARNRDSGNMIHTVYFEHLKLNPHKEIKRLGHFLDVPCTDDFVKEIADKCSFQKLKNVEKCYPKSMEDRLHDISKKTGQYPTLPSIYRKGIIGDWKNMFTVAQNEQFDALYEREMKGYYFSFIYQDPV